MKLCLSTFLCWYWSLQSVYIIWYVMNMLVKFLFACVYKLSKDMIYYIELWSSVWEKEWLLEKRSIDKLSNDESRCSWVKSAIWCFPEKHLFVGAGSFMLTSHIVFEINIDFSVDGYNSFGYFFSLCLFYSTEI